MAEEGGGGGTIDPPAADVAEKARNRFDALNQRLAEEQGLRDEKKSALDTRNQEHDSSMEAVVGKMAGVPVA